MKSIKVVSSHLLLFAALCLLTAHPLSTYSAVKITGIPITDQLISVKIKKGTLEDAIRQIRIQGKLNISYDSKYLKLSQHTTPAMVFEAVKLGTILNKLFENTPVGFQEMGNTLVLFSKNEQDVLKAGKQVKGQVLDSRTSEPIPGAIVSLKNSKTLVLADNNGFYKVNTTGSAADTLVFSFLGYENKIEPITGRTTVNATLLAISRMLNDVAVIGYGTQRKSKVTGSVAQLRRETFEGQQVTSMEQALAGQMAGVQVIQSSGAPGSANTIKIRGSASITAGTNPLIVIDGFPLTDANTSSLLNPADIESIDVLKDASAAAIYGSRGSNGVILITTKKPVAGKADIQFSSFYGTQNVSKTLDLMDAYEYARFVAVARNNYWIELNPAVNKASDANAIRAKAARIPDYLKPYLDNVPGLTNTNWQNELFRDAPIQQYSLSASGGKEPLSYFLSANYLDQQGVIRHSGFTRLNVRANIESRLSKKLKLGMSLAPSYTKYRLISEDTHKKDGLVLLTALSNPAVPAYHSDGTVAYGEQIAKGLEWGTAIIESPLALAQAISDDYSRFRFLGNTSLQYNIVKNLQLKTYFGAEVSSTSDDYFRPSVLGGYNIQAPSQATGRSETYTRLNWIIENSLDYSFTAGKKNTFKILLANTAQKEDTNLNQLSASNFPNDNVKTLNAGIVTGGLSEQEQWSLLSYLARLNYDYDSRYLLNISLRKDGSSRFGKDSKWGYFPAASVGWVISNEPFFTDHNVLTDLKLRASYGKTGNFQIPNYGSQSLLITSNYIFGNSLSNGQAPSTSPNSDLSWEKTRQLNIGLDAGFLKARLTLSAEYYDSKTNGLLLDVPVPTSSGFASSLQNLGSVSNKGWEVSLKANVKAGKLKWNPSFNVSKNINEVIELGPSQTEIISDIHITKVGNPIGAYYGYHIIGVFKDQQDLDSYPHLSTAAIGTYKYEDISGDNKITDADRKILGKYSPDYTFGFNSFLKYRNLDFSFLIQAVQGFEIFNNSKVFTLNGEGWGNGLKELSEGYFVDADNPGNGYARPTAKTKDKLYEKSSHMVEDGSFIRFRNITAGYTLPVKISGKAGIKKIRVYASAENPFTITRYSGYNPEVSSSTYDSPITPGVDYGAYPINKSLVFGLTATF
ncbi:SusC/RagA family TonB-linked outer membrane protein [Desertivirga xinjiangensis]|uniref:SusC/RagA family TonB-linked outer membrane protein n=1 Tax=Desertivirga xinjiangensis TaxID=539206 RepID=UPI002109C9D3|nr:TonB-dependent receptor [Pedobacter xinjiangensis]